MEALVHGWRFVCGWAKPALGWALRLEIKHLLTAAEKKLTRKGQSMTMTLEKFASSSESGLKFHGP